MSGFAKPGDFYSSQRISKNFDTHRLKQNLKHIRIYPIYASIVVYA